jgi:TP901 family phage tail tape measure protein
LIIRELVTKIGFNVDDAGLKKVDGFVTKLTGNLQKMGVAASAALGAVIVPAAQLERALKSAAIASGQTGKSFSDMEENLRARALRLSDELGMSANDIARGFFDVIAAGGKVGSESFEILSKTGLKFAKTIGMETGQAVDQLATSSMIFFNSVDGMTKVADAFFRANQLGSTTVQQLVEAMGEARLASQAANINLNDTTAILTALADAGLKGARGGSAFSQIMQRLLAPVGEGAKVLKQLGVETTNADGSFRNILDILEDLQKAQAGMTEQQQLSNLTMIAGNRAARTLASILQRDIRVLRGFSKEIGSASGLMDEAFNQVMKSASEQFMALMQSIKNLAATIGTPLLAPATRLMNTFQRLIVFVRDFIETNKNLLFPIFRVVGGFLALLAAISAVLFAGKAIAFVFGTAFVAAILKSALAISLLLGKMALLISVFLIFEDLMSAIMGKESFFGDFINFLDEFAKKSILAGDKFGYFAAALKTGLELLIVIPRLIGDAAKYLGIFAGAIFTGRFEDLAKNLREVAASPQSGFQTLQSFMGGQGVSLPSSASGMSQNNQINVEVNVPQGSDPEQTAEAVRQGTVSAMDDLLRQTQLQFNPLVVQ